MGIFNTSLTLNILTKRLKNLTCLNLIKQDDDIRKIISGKREPGIGLFIDLIKKLGYSSESLDDSKLVYFRMNHVMLIEQINYHLNHGEICKSENLLIKLQNEMVKVPLTEQEYLTLIVRLNILQKKPNSETLDLIDKTIKLTYTHYTDDELGINPFAFHEPDLIYYRAKVLADMGDINKAICILLNLLKSLKIIPIADRHKDKILGMLYLTLCELLYITGKHEELQIYAVEGSRLSVTVSSGRYVPDFELFLAKSKYKLTNNINESEKHFMHAYAGFFLLGQKKKVTEVIETAKNDFGLTLNLHGINKLDSLIKSSEKVLSRGMAVDCKNPVELIERLCHERGIKASRIYEGIISKQAYSDAISGKTEFRYFNIEAMGQRLGIDISIYDNFLLNTTDFKMINLRDEINKTSGKTEYDKKKGLLDELHELNMKRECKVITQFVEFMRALMEYNAVKITAEVFRNKLNEIIRITQKRFDEKNFQQLHLTRTEIDIVNSIAGCHEELPDADNVRIYEQLLSMHNRVYIDEIEGDKTIGMIYYNYASVVGLIGDDKFSNKFTSIGLDYVVSSGKLLLAPAFICNMGYNMVLNMSSRADVLPYFALAYYGAASHAPYDGWSKGYMDAVRDMVLEFCGVDLSSC